MTARVDAFIAFLLEQEVLQFGDFTLKSGRRSPYFFNLGKISHGSAYATLGEAYADAIIAAEIEFDVLFGPAYKGIPIAVATAAALARRGCDVGVAYNRKEAKDHGEGGTLVGAPVDGRVLLIDDVLTSGRAIREVLELLAATPARVVGAMVAMDRQEVMDPEASSAQASGESQTAIGQLAGEIAAPVIGIAAMTDLIRYLDGSAESQDYAGILDRMRAYQAEYCVKLT
ncbi:MAG: orotate phosphoribosyltransferase [Pseudomonadota bacterium]